MENRKLQIISSFFGQIGILLTATQNILDFNLLLNEYFWLVLILSWVLMLPLALPKNVKPKLKISGFGQKKDDVINNNSSFYKYKSVLLITLIILFIGLWHVFEQHRSKPDNNTIIKPYEPIGMYFPILNISPFSSNVIHDSRRGDIHVFLKLNQNRTSYEEVNRGWEKIGIPEYDLPVNNIVEYELTIEQQLIQKLTPKCKKYLERGRTISALKNYTSIYNKQKLFKYFQNNSLLLSMPSRRPDITRQLIPSKEEWKVLKKEYPNTYEELTGWICNCIGVPYPVFTCEVENTSDYQLIIQSINYYIIDRWWVWAANQEPEIIIPVQTYVHRLDIESNESYKNKRIKYTSDNNYIHRAFDGNFEIGYWEDGQWRYLHYFESESEYIIPPIKKHLYPSIFLPAKSVTAFDIQLYLGYSIGSYGSENHILMNMEVCTTIGNVRTGEFVLNITPVCDISRYSDTDIRIECP